LLYTSISHHLNLKLIYLSDKQNVN